MTIRDKTTLKTYFNSGDIPSESNFADFIDTIGQPTLVVAASDASDASKGRADYVCDGVNDEVQINAAINALPADGGRVFLTEGDFNLYTAGSIENHGDQYYCVLVYRTHGAVEICGIPGATKLRLANSQTSSSAMILVAGDSQALARTNPTKISGLSFDYNGANQTFPPTRDYASSIILQYSGFTEISNCRFTGNTDWAIWIVYVSPRNIIRDCYFYGECGGIRGEGNDSIIAHNIFDLTYVDNPFCVGVSLAPDSDEPIDDPPTIYYQNYGWTIINNVFRGGIFGIQSSGKASTISGNIFAGSELNLVFNTALYNTIVGNTFYDKAHAIWLYNGPRKNVIANNVMISGQIANCDIGVYEQSSTYVTGDNLIINNSILCNDTAIVTIAGQGSIVRNNIGWKNENSGVAASIADGGTIAHGLNGAPVWANVVPSVSGEFVSVTGMDATNITVAIKKHDGTAGTTQTLYWEAKRQDAISA